MSRKVVEIPVEVWEFSMQDAEHIAALHRETLRLMNENARLKAENERLRKAGDDLEFLVCFNYEGDIKGDKHCMKILDAWYAAKEGKQP